MTAILARGRRSVRLSNDHVVDASPTRPDRGGAAVPVLGETVKVQLRPDDLAGWRLSLASD